MRITKIIGVWAMLAGLLFWNGVLGLAVLNPLLGREAGEMMTFFIALIIIFGASRPFLIEERQRPRAEVARVAILWAVLALALEVVLGRLGQLAGPTLAPRYGMWDGPFWPLVVMCAAMAPITWLRRSDLPFPRVTK